MNDDVIALAAGRRSLAELYREHRLALVRLGVLLLGDQAAAEDVVQDVFAALHRRDVEVRPAYLRAAVVNSCRSVIRRRIVRRRRVAPADVAGEQPGEKLELVEEHRAVLRALDTLPRRQREVLVLRYYSGLSVAEVAETLGVHEGTVKSSSARGLDALRRQLEGRV